MDSQRVHMRSTVTITQSLLDALPDVTPDFELEATERVRIVGNTIMVNDGFLRGHHVILVGETITQGFAGDELGTGLVNTTAGPQQNGRAGHPITVVAGRLIGGRVTTRGQQGGKGKKGRDGVQMPPIEQPPVEPPFPQGPPPQNGRSGERGGPGMKGGPGGPVDITLRTPSSQTANWFGVGGFKGEGGQGGDPEKGIGGGSDGEPGGQGLDGAAGDNVAATVRIVDANGFLAAVSAALVGGPAADWVRFRQAFAEEEFRRGDVVVALAEYDGVQALKPFEPALSDLLPDLVRDNRTLSGVARDEELVPDVAFHARKYRDAARDLRRAVVTDGAVLAGNTAATLASIKAQLGELVRPQGILDTQLSDLGTQAELGLKALAVLKPRTGDTIDRLNELLADPTVSPVVKVDGAELNAVAIAGALASTLGADDPTAAPSPVAGTLLIPTDDTAPDATFGPSIDVVTLLPGNLELLVHRSVRASRQLPPAELAKMTTRARGLAGFAEWGSVRTGGRDNEGIPIAVNLGRIAADLRGAAGERPVLDLLIELTEITHGWRLARARIEQQLAGRTTMKLRRVLAKRAIDRFAPANPDPADLLPGLRCLLDALAWQGERADRAVDIATFGLTRPPRVGINRFPFPPQLIADRAALLPLLYSPDWALELREKSPLAISATNLDSIANGVMAVDHKPLRESYLKRGFAFVGAEPSYRELTFTRAERPAPSSPHTARPDLFDRLNAVGNFWFDLTLADLAGETGQGPQVEARVVGAELVVAFEEPAPPSFGMTVTHYGLSVQQDLGGGLHRQVMLPTEITLNLGSSCGSGNCNEASGKTLATEGQEINFPSYGRGAAAGWLVKAGDVNTDFSLATSITVRIYYEALVPSTAVSLRSVSFAGGSLRVGSSVPVRVRLTAPAPAGGATVFLTSSDPTVIEVPSGVTVSAGATEATTTAKVLAPTGPRLPVLSARTKDGVTRTVRPAVPAPVRPPVSTVRLTAANQPANVTGIALVPGAGKVPAEVLTTLALPLADVGKPQPAGLLKGRGANDLAARRDAELGDLPRSLAFDPTRKRIYVINNSRGPANLAMLDATTLKKLAEQPIGASVDVQVDSAAGLVYVSEFQTGQILVLSADDLALRETITDDEGRLRKPHGLAVFPGSGNLATIYVARAVRGVPDEDSAVTRIVRLANGQHQVAKSVSLGGVGLQPVDVAVDFEKGMVFVACLGGGDEAPQLVVLRHGSMTELGRSRLPSGGRGVATRPGTGMAYVVGEAGLTLVDGATQTIASVTPLTGMPLAVAVDPDTGAAYIGMRDDARLIRVDAPPTAAPVAW